MSETVGSLWRKLKPYVEELLSSISSSSSSGGGGAPSPHDLNSAHHTGSIADSQGPQFLKTDGTRPITGNMDMGAGVTIDGVDPDVLNTAYAAHDAADAVTAHGSAGAHNHQTNAAGGLLDHGAALSGLTDDDHAQYAGANSGGLTRSAYQAERLNKSTIAGNGLTGGGLHTADVTIYIASLDGTISIGSDDIGVNQGSDYTWSGAHDFQNTIISQHHNPQANDQWDLGAQDLRWRQIFASELETILLKYNAVLAVDGKIILAKQNGTFQADVSAAATTIDFGQAMTASNFIYVAGNSAIEYMTIGSLVSGTTYNVTRNVDGSGANDWPQGQAWINLGGNGDLRIEITGGSNNAPKIQLLKQGATYNATTEVIGIAAGGMTLDAGSGKFSTASIEWERLSTRYLSIGCEVNLGLPVAGYLESAPDLKLSTSDSAANIILTPASGGVVQINAPLLIGASYPLRAGGTSFPASPADNDLYYRTDRDLLYFYSSSLAVWLTVHEYQIAMPDQRIPDGTLTSANITATTSGTEQTIWLWPLQGTYKTLLTGMWFNITKGGTHDVSNNFTVSLKAFDYAAAATTLTTWTTNNRSARFEETYGTVLNTDGTSGASPNRFALRVYKTGTPGNLQMGFIVKYRLVG